MNAKEKKRLYDIDYRIKNISKIKKFGKEYRSRGFVPSHKYLVDVFEYNQSSGFFLRRKTGCKSGSPHSCGYISIGIKGGVFFAHRLAWFYVHGEWPSGQIDHINGDRKDNRICNLRVVSQSENNQNQKKARSDNKLGILGVHADTERPGNYKAFIRVDKKSKFLGRFKTIDKASAAYKQAKLIYHPTAPI